MTDTFSPPVGPGPPLDRQVTPRVLSAPFGDGYRQDAGDGLNAIPRVLSLVWDNLAVADAETIEAFLVAGRGYIAFFWTDPREASPRKWKCPTWSRVSVNGVTDRITATFEEVFDL